MQPGPEGDPYTARASPVRRRLLALLRERESGRDAHELAEVLALHVTTVRSHLQILERAGLVTSRPDPRGRSGRPRTVYNATPEPGAPTDGRAQPTAYQELADVLAAHLDTTEGGTASPEQAGMLWAARSAPTASPATDETEAAERVDRVCHELGFDPRLVAEGDGWRIDLRACPFRPVARAHPNVVCAAHQGLIRGTLDRAGFPAMHSELHPFVEPELCVAHLHTRAGRAEGGAPAVGS